MVRPALSGPHLENGQGQRKREGKNTDCPQQNSTFPTPSEEHGGGISDGNIILMTLLTVVLRIQQKLEPPVCIFTGEER